VRPLLGWAIPKRDRTVPREGAAVPLEGSCCPFEGRQRPKEGARCPLEGRSGPFVGGTAPFVGATGPKEGATGPKEGARCPFWGAHRPREGRYNLQEGTSKNRVRNPLLEEGSKPFKVSHLAVSIAFAGPCGRLGGVSGAPLNGNPDQGIGEGGKSVKAVRSKRLAKRRSLYPWGAYHGAFPVFTLAR